MSGKTIEVTGICSFASLCLSSDWRFFANTCCFVSLIEPFQSRVFASWAASLQLYARLLDESSKGSSRAYQSAHFIFFNLN
jgi:hypothetical protein